MSEDLSTRVLARIDHLEALARAAEEEDVADSGMIRNFTSAYTEHIDTWDPAAVHTLTRNARRIVDAHTAQVDMALAVFQRREVCAVCRTPEQWREGQDWGSRRVTYPCPTLTDVARMLGVDPEGASAA
ncbi:hypothetical protein [Frankia sp. AgB32]|uniref:hypothetical protein n=1 Tax=Frankia sp. AgB32 TaxID=631119 RepID=UPI00200DAE00|nr:hypothetical protein [Frankia sp. AgB32]MCK9898136.1 hypothetical protein [Frankia sp. AgB32]